MRARPDRPIHWPVLDRNSGATRLRMFPGIVANMSAFAIAPSAPASCAIKMSAGVLSPSSRRRAAISAVLPYFTFIETPLARSYDSRIGPIKLSDRPEYTVRLWSLSAHETNAMLMGISEINISWKRYLISVFNVFINMCISIFYISTY